jgi:hypothetical protein
MPDSQSKPSSKTTATYPAGRASIPLGETYPVGTQFRLASVAMALGGAQEMHDALACAGNKGAAVLGIIDLAIAELRRIDEERDALKGEVTHG